MSVTGYIILGCAFALLLTCYIIAIVKSKRGEMVFTANGWDMALLLGCPISFFLGWCGGMEPPYNIFQYIVFSISGACLLGTILFSIFTNLDSIWKILCSILAKLFTVWLTLLIIMLILILLVGYVIIQFMKSRDEDKEEYILVKYDKFLHAYVGYRITE